MVQNVIGVSPSSDAGNGAMI